MEDKKQLLANAEIPEDLAPPPYSGVSPVIVHPQCQQHFTDNTNGFDRNSPRYRTCCCHVTVGSMVFAILDLIFAKLTLVVLIVSLINLQREENILTLSRHGILAFWVIFGFAILQIVFSWLLLYGVRKSRNCLLLPDMVLKGIYIAVAMVSLMLCVWLLVVNDELSETLAASGQFDHAQLAYLRQMGTALISGALIYYLLLITYYSYYLHVLQRCYRYIAEKNFHQFNQNVIVYKVEIGGDINKPQRF